MDGPRSLRPDELPSLSRLVDKVFGSRHDGDMFRMFPTLFCEQNCESLLVVADNDVPVSHVGMTLRWASLGGCTVGVACIGAVATYEEHRGNGYATRLMAHACEKAVAWGADIMMISGGRGLYRRMGSADVGLDYGVTVDEPTAGNLSTPGFAVSDMEPGDASACAALYRTKPVHYIRTAEDWREFTRARYCMCREVDFLMVRKGPALCAYFVAAHEPEKNSVRIMEFAGDSVALAATIPYLLTRYQEPAVTLHLQAEDTALRALLEDAGALVTPTKTTGTLLLLDANRLMKRLHPFFEAQVGREDASRLRFHKEGDTFIFALGQEECAVAGNAAAAEAVFGSHEHPAPGALLERLFPAPTLWYGLSYI